jgi:hypothetical protein
MRAFLLLGFILVIAGNIFAQRECETAIYQQSVGKNNPLLEQNIKAIENFIQQQKPATSARFTGTAVIKIPVVFHVIYHHQAENISDAKILSQLKALNECFRRQQSDSAKTPAVFKLLAADCEIEFELATSDPHKRSTTGIIRKYTPVERWKADDLIKSSAQTGDDPWDPASYLNIWVCNMRGVAGFSSVVGGPADKDGVVLDYTVTGVNNKVGYEMGKTGVHEVGHWLGLKHIWGDENCGDDLVGDTPKQSTYSVGCPTGIRSSCDNGVNGNMYMNYMDFTNDACTNLFTEGQKTRMRSLFAPGGPRYSLLSSTGLDAPLYNEIPLPEEEGPKFLQPRLYPNPVNNELTIDISYDARWIGKTFQVISVQGQPILQITITSKIQKVNIGHLAPGIYFISFKKEDGETIKHKIIKM